MRQLRNFTEETIKSFVDKEFPLHDICQCADCHLDVMAIMLNEFKAHYVVTEQGALFAQLAGDFEPQYRIDLLSSMARAVKVVKDSPRHAISD